jgi:hypothetical protein
MRVTIGCTLLVASLASAACHTMSPVTLDQVGALKPDRLWVTESDRSVVVVTGPINVAGDTLQGYINGKYEEMPTTELKQLVVQKPATTRTVLLVSAVAVGFGGFIFALTGSSGAATRGQTDFCDKHPDDPTCTSAP